jgi:hypothetical protein
LLLIIAKPLSDDPSRLRLCALRKHDSCATVSITHVTQCCVEHWACASLYTGFTSFPAAYAGCVIPSDTNSSDDAITIFASFDDSFKVFLLGYYSTQNTWLTSSVFVSCLR